MKWTRPAGRGGKALCSRFGGCAVATPGELARLGTPAEGGRAYLGRSVSCLVFGAEHVARRVIAAQKSAEGIVGGQVAYRRPERRKRRVGRGISCHPTPAGWRGDPRVSTRRQNNQLEPAFGAGVTGEDPTPCDQDRVGAPARSAAFEGTEVPTPRDQDRVGTPARSGGPSARKPGGPLRGLLSARNSLLCNQLF